MERRYETTMNKIPVAPKAIHKLKCAIELINAMNPNKAIKSRCGSSFSRFTIGVFRFWRVAGASLGLLPGVCTAPAMPAGCNRFKASSTCLRSSDGSKGFEASIIVSASSQSVQRIHVHGQHEGVLLVPRTLFHAVAKFQCTLGLNLTLD